MEPKRDKLHHVADHPRYGRLPNLTGLNPNPNDANVHLHWNTWTRQEIIEKYKSASGEVLPFGDFSADVSYAKRIPNTAILADPSKQTRATIPVTHYFDLERICLDCRRRFIFFAEEQKYWYEELGFGLESDCIRCTDCRKRQQEVARLRRRYELLFHIENKSEEIVFELATCCVKLVEHKVFTIRRLEFARMLLNRIDRDSELRKRKEYVDLVRRSRPWEIPSSNQAKNQGGESS